MTLHELASWLAAALPGTMVPASSLSAAIEAAAHAELAPAPAEPRSPTWREKLWTVHADTRLTAPEAAEALGRGISWLYKRTGVKAVEKLPCRRQDGELVFVAGELRQWIREHEEVIEPGRPERALRIERGRK